MNCVIYFLITIKKLALCILLLCLLACTLLEEKLYAKNQAQPKSDRRLAQAQVLDEAGCCTAGALYICAKSEAEKPYIIRRCESFKHGCYIDRHGIHHCPPKKRELAPYQIELCRSFYNALIDVKTAEAEKVRLALEAEELNRQYEELSETFKRVEAEAEDEAEAEVNQAHQARHRIIQKMLFDHPNRIEWNNQVLEQNIAAYREIEGRLQNAFYSDDFIIDFRQKYSNATVEDVRRAFEDKLDKDFFSYCVL